MSKDATKPAKASKVDQIAGLRARRFGALSVAAKVMLDPKASIEPPSPDATALQHKRPAKKKGKGPA